VRRLLWVLLVGLALALSVLIARNDQGAVGNLTTSDFASLAIKITILVVVGSAVLTLFQDRSQALESALLWVVLALVLVLVYTFRFDVRDSFDRALAELVPGHGATTRGRAVEFRTVEFSRSRAGEFPIMAEVNEAHIWMILDTGANSVVLTNEAAKAAGFPLESGMVKYSVNVETANGRALAAPVTIDKITIGSIAERSIPALIAPPGQLKTSLLGMSFLDRLQSWEVRGDRLVLRAYP
jgi:aspartyl protease family protein